MGPLIDAELEKIDKKHAILSRLSTDLVEALNLYHTLMRSSYSTEGMVVGVHGQPYMHPGVAPSPGPVPGHGYPSGVLLITIFKSYTKNGVFFLC